MDDAEAAARSTSEQSSLPPLSRLPPPYPPTSDPSYPSTSDPSYSSQAMTTFSLTANCQEDVNTGSDYSSTDSLQPQLKRPRLDSSGMPQDGLWAFTNMNKPIGIAQPFPKRESVDESVCDTLGKSEGKAPQESEDPTNLKKLPTIDNLNLDKNIPDSDSKVTDISDPMNQSSKNKPSMKDGGESKDDFGSESSHAFDYIFEPPTESEDGGCQGRLEANRQSQVAGQKRELKETTGSHGDDRTKSLKAPARLPSNRRYHVFVTHSTSDQQWAKNSVVSPLSPHWKVKACYQLMPDQSRYDDASIKECMKQSCLIVIGLSQAYINSARCKKEWQLAEFLSNKVTVVVAAVGTCSRPGPLRRFLYLDFIDKEKRRTVWDKLNGSIATAVQKLLAQEESPHVEQLVTPKQTPSFLASSSPSQDSHGDEQSEGETSQMMDDFATGAWEQSGNVYPEMKDMAEQDQWMDRHHQVVASAEEEELPNSAHQIKHPDSDDPECTPTTALSCDHVQTPTDESVPADNDGGEDSEVKQHHTSDVEDGEVSDSSGETNSQEDDPKLSDVASFYNNLARPDADKRNQSPIKLMRNFNNWVKSVLIRTYLDQCTPGCTALDICCGKGGDLLKWKEGQIRHLVCADISNESILAAQDRYRSDKMMKGRRRPPFSADFYVADCAKEQLAKLQEEQDCTEYYHISSCQFSIHYSFESYTNAHMMLRNACENLRPGGFFIGTTIDANELVYRLQEKGCSEDNTVSIGNDLYTVTLDPSLNVNKLPLFNARYNFRLHGVVDLPEYLVHFPLLVKMLEPFEMELVLRQNFYDFFEEHRYNSADADLLFRMEAFDKATGSMSQQQWEIIGLYLVYVFRKKFPSTQP